MEAKLQVKSKDLLFIAHWEIAKAPKTCAAFKELLPLTRDLITVRWSGEAAWSPIDDLPLNLQFENHTCYPSKGQLLLYPGFISGKEILIPYGATAFGSRVGLLAGNHFATILHGLESLEELGRRVHWEGSQSIEFSEFQE